MGVAKGGKKTKEVQEAGLKTAIEESADGAVPARVVELLGSLGPRGGQQIRCKVLAGRELNKIMRRNVMGPVRIGDVLMLKQTEIEAQPLKGGRK